MKPKIGDKFHLAPLDDEPTVSDIYVVFELYDDVNVWWDTAYGESKVALLDALAEYGQEKASTAEWYAMVESSTYEGEVMAVASFEVIKA